MPSAKNFGEARVTIIIQFMCHEPLFIYLSPLFVKKTSNFGQYFGHFEKLQVIGLHFASISYP